MIELIHLHSIVAFAYSHLLDIICKYSTQKVFGCGFQCHALLFFIAHVQRVTSRFEECASRVDDVVHASPRITLSVWMLFLSHVNLLAPSGAFFGIHSHRY